MKRKIKRLKILLYFSNGIQFILQINVKVMFEEIKLENLSLHLKFYIQFAADHQFLF